ncbi:MAG TPA: hypothetical protein VJC03_02730, partial [bacterium]|nr:hypothetical protein [bacterium]
VDVSGYNAYRSSISGSGYSKLNSSLIQTVAYQDGIILQPQYYTVTAMDGTGHESAYSNEVEVIPDTSPPAGSAAFISKIGILGTPFGVTVTGVEDPETGIASVKAYYRTENSSWTAVILSSSTPGLFTGVVFSVTDLAQLEGKYADYYVEIKNRIGLTTYLPSGGSSSPQRVDISRQTVQLNVESGEISVPDTNPEDGTTSVYIPPGALKNAVDIVITQVPYDGESSGRSDEKVDTRLNNGKPVSVYQFATSAGQGLRFEKNIRITLLYFDLDHDGFVELEDGTQTGIPETALRAYYWDILNSKWRYVGGAVDIATNTVTFSFPHFSKFALFPAIGSVKPEQKFVTYFTPAVF